MESKAARRRSELNHATDEMRGRDGPRHGEEYAPYSLGLEPVDGLLIIHGGWESSHPPSCGDHLTREIGSSAQLQIVTEHASSAAATAEACLPAAMPFAYGAPMRSMELS